MLRAHPQVRDAAAFVHLDAAGREEIWAAVVTDQIVDLAAILASCRETLGDKTPDRLCKVDALPRTETGKVQRIALRRQFAEA